MIEPRSVGPDGKTTPDSLHGTYVTATSRVSGSQISRSQTASTTATPQSSTAGQSGSDTSDTSLPSPTTPDNTPASTSTSSTVSSKSTSPAAAPPRSSPAPIPAASAAGLGVGCAFAGLLLGLVAACIFLRRKYRRRAPRRAPFVHHRPGPAVVSLRPGTITAHHEPGTSSGSAGDIQLNHFLLDVTPDKEISMEMRALGMLIRQHVESHYHRDPVTADAGILSQSLVGLGFSEGRSPLGAQEVAALCLNPSTRQDALQHVLLRIIFASIDFHARSELSLLPISVAAFLNELPYAENGLADGSRGGGQLAGQPEQHQIDAFNLAFYQWRRLSVFLLHPDRDQRTPLPVHVATVTPQAQALTAALNTALNLFTGADSVSKQEQTRHLEAVVMECAKLGYVLLSQPSDWRFITEDPGARSGSRGLVVEAGLMKLSNREGVRYQPPQIAVEPQVQYVMFS